MRSSALLMLSLAGFSPLKADWPQWRGPLRNGVLPGSPKLMETLPKTGLTELWHSEPIPSGDDGGFSSPICAEGKVFLSLVWHRNAPSQKRQIDDLVLRQLGFEGLSGLSDELIAEIEHARETLPATLRGKNLDDFTAKWLNDRLTPKLKEVYSGFIAERFRKGKAAIPLSVFQTLQAHRAHVFADEAEMLKWMDAQGWAEVVRREISAAVPQTLRLAEDTVICLDLASGATRWKTSAPGIPTGRFGSSTPCVRAGSVFAAGSSRVWCLDTASGAIKWNKPVSSERGIGASPLVFDDKLVIVADAVSALAASDGAELWRQPKGGGGNSSPAVCTSEDKTLVIVNGRKELFALDPATGEVVWTAPGGGASSPAIERDTLVVQTKGELGLVAYKLSPGGATKLWNKPLAGLRKESSPLIWKGRVYLIDNSVQRCLALADGTEHWTLPLPAEIASPALADAKLLALAGGGNTLVMWDATRAERKELGRATVRASSAASPCICDGRLLLRSDGSVKCWSLLP